MPPSPRPASPQPPSSNDNVPKRSNTGRSGAYIKRNQPSHRSLAQEKLDSDVVQGCVVFMAIANEMSMSTLYRRLLRTEAQTNVHPSAIGAVLWLVRKDAPADRPCDAFVFSYGVLVVWGGDDVDCEFFQSLVAEDALQLRKIPAVDTMQYCVSPKSTTSIQRDIIILTAEAINSMEPDLDASELMKPHLERMAISCGLAQSIKLGAFESAMRSTIEKTRHLPEQLARTGEITASHRDVSQLMGRLFLDRYRYHLSGDLLVTPAFFWENEAYYPAYKRVERYLEVSERGDVLNKRVEVVQELYQLLGEEISKQNSMALEMAITIMIAFEILLTLISLAKQSLRTVFVGFFLFFCLAFLGWLLRRLYMRRRSTIILNNSRMPPD